MVAKTGCVGNVQPVSSIFCGSSIDGAPAPHHPDPSVYEPWEMTEREKYLTTKCIRLIQG